MSKPLFEKLNSFSSSGVLSMHMPGHKRNAEKFPWLKSLDLTRDITEISGFDNLNDPETVFAELNARLARLRGAEKSFALVNGSTGGILAAFKLCLPNGGKALISRGSHKAVYAAAEIVGADLCYVVPDVIPELGAFGAVTPGMVEAELKKDKEVGLVAITSPTYEGVISDVAGLAEVCHKYGVPLLVDAAHGAHFGFGGFPEGAIRLGADIAVESLHKTLPSPTQTAVLSVRSSLIDSDRAQLCVSAFQSSSPSYILSAGIDACARYMEERGETEARLWYERVSALREKLKRLENLRLYSADNIDPSKLVLTCDNGYAAMELFRAEGVELEMVSDNYVIAMTGLGDTDETLSAFFKAAEKVDKVVKKRRDKTVTGFTQPEKRLSPRQALSNPSEPVPLRYCDGRIAAEYVWKYPPGSPVIIPGELVCAETLSASDSIRSSYGGVPASIRCVKE